MKPYYEDTESGIVIYHGDCREVLPELNADVLISDPPYGVAYVSNSSKYGKTKPIAGDGDTCARDSVLEWWGDRPYAVFGAWNIPRPKCRNRLVWDKGNSPGMGDLSMPWGKSDEEIYVWGLGWSGKRIANVLRFPVQGAADKTRPNHPTPKPIELMRAIVSYAPPGTILDPFMGSGTTLRAAKDLGRKAIGIEIEERYCEIAANRLAQGVLFGGAS